ncbi:MAG: aromatic-ring-hydroxylating dioxygenase subunit beta [Alphaproteobacteria bacterium]|nr:aromatic-ring-hydroxylating dioxygenase subunit beta [Alphaproteobacteria bacterium]
MAPEAVARHFELQQLYTDYALCIDADELERWPDFFAEDCAYRVTSAENYEAGLPLALIYATSKGMLRDRVAALREANIYEPQRYRHFISCLKVAEQPDGAVAAVAHVMVVRIMQDGAMSLFAVGRYIDRVERRGSDWKFTAKTVVLDSRTIDTLLAIPL